MKGDHDHRVRYEVPSPQLVYLVETTILLVELDLLVQAHGQMFHRACLLLPLSTI